MVTFETPSEYTLGTESFDQSSGKQHLICTYMYSNYII